MNIGVDQSEVGQIIWRDRDDVRQDVTPLKTYGRTPCPSQRAPSYAVISQGLIPNSHLS